MNKQTKPNQMPKETWETVKRGLDIKINTKQIERDAKAAQRVAARKEETQIRLPMIIEQNIDYQGTKDIAKKHNGALIKLERLVQLLNDPDFVKSIEDTKSYKRDRYTFFWIDTVGTNLNGYYRMNPQGKTLDEMFTFISRLFDSEVKKVPSNEILYFKKTDLPLAVEVFSKVSFLHARLEVSGDGFWPYSTAPLVVVEQASAKPVTVWQRIGKPFQYLKK